MTRLHASCENFGAETSNEYGTSQVSRWQLQDNTMANPTIDAKRATMSHISVSGHRLARAVPRLSSESRGRASSMR
ncbi:hypothetical protein RRG08_006688 [Elysia crispata]|uniref:Uncharacterized protein n=1 Tax=Elysia crispata TaxID=231223 RepID=A0AAE1D6D5_9GAST|nr:hypothetical protein RRG08_006688 [Elysia crispata]